jgi:indolepyruvate ferredoxin oxidoreductase alpha subunit
MDKIDKKLLMGNEAIALGALRAGLDLAAGYPGTPSSEILETLAREKGAGVYAEWSVNEKAALETAAGAAIAGARTLVTMKQVGLNVASDPLMSLNYVGVKGAMVVVVADDPGPISSQTEQDTRHFAQYAHIPLFDPSTPEEAYLMVARAFALSARIGRPVLFRPTTRVCHSYAGVTLLPPLERTGTVNGGWSRDNGRWIIFPRLAYQNHITIVETEKKLGDEAADYEENVLSGSGKRGLAAGGVAWTYVQEAVGTRGCKLLKVSTFPFSGKRALEFLDGLDEVLVIEELDTVI